MFKRSSRREIKSQNDAICRIEESTQATQDHFQSVNRCGSTQTHPCFMSYAISPLETLHQFILCVGMRAGVLEHNGL